MRNLWTIIKKELRRFFTDKRMLISLLLPGIMIFVLYTIMGDVMMNSLVPGDEETYKVLVINEPDLFNEQVNDMFNIEYVEDMSKDEALDALKNKELDLYLVFPADFFENYQNGTPQTVEAHFNSTNTKSTTLWGVYQPLITQSVLQYQGLTVSGHDNATQKDSSIMIITSLVPFLLITFLFSGSMAVAPESIAGEKERGTMASLLITPVKRSNIALGKIIALSLTALTSAASSFIGLMLSIPKLMGTSTNVDLSIYGAGEYIMLLLVIMSTVLIFTVMISLISTYAKSIKEAAGFSTPLMILVMLVGVTTLMGTAATNHFLYLIPVYNSVNALLAIFSTKVDMINLVITILTNLAVTGLGIFVLTRMFNSEKIMFRK